MDVERFLMNALNTPVRRFIIPLPDGKTPYLERFILDEGKQELPKDQRSKVYLHLIYESDGDRDPHDHPFDFASKIIWGSYREHNFERYCTRCSVISYQDVTSCGKCRQPLSARDTGSLLYEQEDKNYKVAHELHRLTVIQGPVVTLVTRDPKVREWGFQTPDGWEHHASYIKRKFPDAQPTEVD